jgi:hypothetical protein
MEMLQVDFVEAIFGSPPSLRGIGLYKLIIVIILFDYVSNCNIRERGITQMVGGQERIK